MERHHTVTWFEECLAALSLVEHHTLVVTHWSWVTQNLLSWYLQCTCLLLQCPDEILAVLILEQFHLTEHLGELSLILDLRMLVEEITHLQRTMPRWYVAVGYLPIPSKTCVDLILVVEFVSFSFRLVRNFHRELSRIAFEQRTFFWLLSLLLFQYFRHALPLARFSWDVRASPVCFVVSLPLESDRLLEVVEKQVLWSSAWFCLFLCAAICITFGLLILFAIFIFRWRWFFDILHLYLRHFWAAVWSLLVPLLHSSDFHAINSIAHLVVLLVLSCLETDKPWWLQLAALIWWRSSATDIN